jgi:hypothetical protein
MPSLLWSLVNIDHWVWSILTTSSKTPQDIG